MTDPLDPPDVPPDDRPTPTGAGPVPPRVDVDPLEAAVRAHDRIMFRWIAVLLICVVLVLVGAAFMGRLP